MDNFLDMAALELSRVTERHDTNRAPVTITVPWDFPVEDFKEFLVYHGYQIDKKISKGIDVKRFKMLENQSA